MNNNPKTNNGAIFFILIPLFIIIAAFIYDNVVRIVSDKNYIKTTETIMKDVLTNSYTNKEEMAFETVWSF